MKLRPFIVGIIVAALAMLAISFAGPSASAADTAPSDQSLWSYKSL